MHGVACDQTCAGARMDDVFAVPAELPLQVEQLWTYPIKSCAGWRVPRTVLHPTGLEWDRAWMLVDETGEFVSQRDWPRMALIRPEVHSGWLQVQAPGMLTLQVGLDCDGLRRRVRVWDDEVWAFDMGDTAAQWFTDFLAVDAPHRQRLRLVRFDTDESRWSSHQWTKGVAAPNLFSDGYPVLVLSRASLDDLNQRLRLLGHAPVGPERFRPNVLLGGVDAHDEDRLSVLRLEAAGAHGPAVLQLVKPCARCSIPDLDPLTSLRVGEVSPVLQTYRQDRRLMGAITFGMNAIVRHGGGLHVYEGMSGHGVWSAWDDD